MRRLTKADSQGNWGLDGVAWKDIRAGIVIQRDVSEKLYGALCKLRDYENTGLSPDDVERINCFSQNQSSKLLAKLAEEQKKHTWIPVSERLPEDGTYLCTFAGEIVGEAEPFTGMCEIENRKWDEEDCVIAWMPLPEPYKDPGDE